MRLHATTKEPPTSRRLRRVLFQPGPCLALIGRSALTGPSAGGRPRLGSIMLTGGGTSRQALRVVGSGFSTACSALLERCFREAEAGGSNPLTPTSTIV